LEIAQNAGSMAEIPASQFTHDERMDQNQAVAQQLGKVVRAFTKVGDPNRGVHQNHACRPGRRLGILRSAGAVPPKAASRRAASRAIKASRPAWTKAVFWRMPVNCEARSSRLSSMISVVLICIHMHNPCISSSKSQYGRNSKGFHVFGTNCEPGMAWPKKPARPRSGTFNKRDFRRFRG
jgi:hypothetical protein